MTGASVSEAGRVRVATVITRLEGALRRPAALPRQGNFGVVHTHCAKAGAVGRLAAHRNVVSRIVHTYHGFPFHEFQSAPAAARMWPSSTALAG